MQPRAHRVSVGPAAGRDARPAGVRAIPRAAFNPATASAPLRKTRRPDAPSPAAPPGRSPASGAEAPSAVGRGEAAAAAAARRSSAAYPARTSGWSVTGGGSPSVSASEMPRSWQRPLPETSDSRPHPWGKSRFASGVASFTRALLLPLKKKKHSSQKRSRVNTKRSYDTRLENALGFIPTLQRANRMQSDWTLHSEQNAEWEVQLFKETNFEFNVKNCGPKESEKATVCVILQLSES